MLDGCIKLTPKDFTRAGVVSSESVRMSFTCLASKDADFWSFDIQNSYLQAPTTENHFIICGQEFVLENVEIGSIVSRAVHDGNESIRDVRNHLRSCMEHLCFTSYLADPDVWTRPAIKSNDQECYDYVLLHTDDTLVESDKAKNII